MSTTDILHRPPLSRAVYVALARTSITAAVVLYILGVLGHVNMIWVPLCAALASGLYSIAWHNRRLPQWPYPPLVVHNRHRRIDDLVTRAIRKALK